MASVAAFACGALVAVPLVLDQPAALASSPAVNQTTAGVAATAAVLAAAVQTPTERLPVSRPTDAPSAEPAAGSTKTVRTASASSTERPVKTFNGRPVRPVRTITMRVTAYSPDERSCGDSADGITASGYSVWTNGGRMVAADTRLLPLGSLVSVPGYDGGAVVPVLDRGGAIKGNRLDVLFATHDEARRWGVKTIKVTVYEYADGRPNDFRESHRPRR
jgi:3D (Asp-Asp-Asp) domain-containing protein